MKSHPSLHVFKLNKGVDQKCREREGKESEVTNVYIILHMANMISTNITYFLSMFDAWLMPNWHNCMNLISIGDFINHAWFCLQVQNVYQYSSDLMHQKY